MILFYKERLIEKPVEEAYYCSLTGPMIDVFKYYQTIKETNNKIRRHCEFVKFRFDACEEKVFKEAAAFNHLYMIKRETTADKNYDWSADVEIYKARLRMDPSNRTNCTVEENVIIKKHLISVE